MRRSQVDTEVLVQLLRKHLDRFIDNLVTSRWFGFPVMIGILTVVFWLTIFV